MSNCLYDLNTREFVHLAQTKEIAIELKERFKLRFGSAPSDSEVTSWSNSLYALATEVLHDQRLQDTHIFLEFMMPLSSARCDVILVGQDANGTHNAVVMELKQWQYVRQSSVRDSVSLNGRDVRNHPSAQVKAYCNRLRYYHEAFTDSDMSVTGCSYLHNLSDKKSIDLLTSPNYFGIIEKEYPIFFKHDADNLTKYLVSRIGHGNSYEVVKAFKDGRVKPSTKLLDMVAQAIDNRFEWCLLDEQLDVFNTVVSKVEQAKDSSTKSIVVVRGGPGTGKSVLAIQLLAYAARNHWKVAHATGSKAFKTVLQALTQNSADDLMKKIHSVRLKKELPVKELFTQFADIGKVHQGTFDLVVHDEAHRLWDFRRNRFGQQVSNVPMIQEVTDASCVSVFFLDDNQAVRANEIGSVEYITNFARDRGIDTVVIDLNVQFRCAGSASYMEWVDHSLGFNAPKSLGWKDFEVYDLQIVESMQEMQSKLDALQAQGEKCRLTAGFCWKWSEIQGNGQLVHDIKDERFNGWSAPWIEKDMSKVSPGEDKYFKWATDDYYYSQVGSIYSVQGFEFDYVGLIFGEDLVWRNGQWVSDLSKNKDSSFKRNVKAAGEDPTEKLRNVYRVLMTRGMKGTFVYFLDKETREYLEENLLSSQQGE
ncbi:DUF2075 domain-containing protein [Alicyclobacillus dauci]|uniref:DUF2075 domain-containing protein n=1 Tax=Alicyclobacillus dauci TaxID=1475485 RepID=A0ABY6Z2R0_9BACL|nr:DUF2075 domain-containing protein [Alicyclobacillus dauci]WAH37030.1 DUF2075 domain-containing protein [Alicyclobacillus dauci]